MYLCGAVVVWAAPYRHPLPYVDQAFISLSAVPRAVCPASRLFSFPSFPVVFSVLEKVVIASSRVARGVVRMEEISNVVKNYYAVIGQKDDDIFQLYQDNRRLQKELNDALSGREENETELRSLRLLVAAQKTEIVEKRALTDALQAEGSVLRDAVGRVRSALGMISELDYTAGDVAEVCIADHVRCNELAWRQEQLVYAVECSSLLTVRVLVDLEQRERQVIADAYDSTCTGVWPILSQCFLLSSAWMERANARCADLEHSHREAMEALDRRAQAAQREHGCAIAVLEEKLTTGEAEVERLRGKVAREIAEKELLAVAGLARVDLLVERCADLERILASCLRALCRHDRWLMESRTEVKSAKERCDALQTRLSEARALLRARQSRVASASAGGSGAKGAPDALAADEADMAVTLGVLREEHEALRQEWRRSVERERQARQRLASAVRRHKAERTASESTTADIRRQCSVLENELKQMRLEAKRHAKESRHLQQQLEEVTADVKQRDERIRELEASDNTLSSRCAMLSARVEALEDDLASLQREKGERVSALENMLEETRRETGKHVTELEEQLRSERENFLCELKEWSSVLDNTRKKVVDLEGERDRERMLRKMLLEQQHDEARLLRSVMMSEKAMNSQAMQKRIDDLEQVCRRSAEVIVCLREAAHRSADTAVVRDTVLNAP
uniref:Uncharacterized protein n=1 Tax=Trypanosoma vivax (strain Y486) TaxID=1055687 RepID=G0UBY6_TRYVY|nr:conserved hypothetical protein [Trypanosoma vivax Y486]